MKDFKKFGSGFGGRDRGGNSGGAFSPRRSIGGRSSFGGPKTMHSAICSGCGQSCEVPFRPTGEKPVFCSNCFSEQRGESSSPSRFPRRETSVAPRTDRGLEEIKSQLVALNTKMDKLLEVLSNPTQTSSVVEVKADKPSGVKMSKKATKVVKLAKKTAKKK